MDEKIQPQNADYSQDGLGASTVPTITVDANAPLVQHNTQNNFNLAYPLPSPETLKAYDGVIENGAERIFRMAEKEQEQRHANEKTALSAEIKDARRSQNWGGGLVLLCLLLAFLTAYLRLNYWVSALFVCVPVFGIIREILRTRYMREYPARSDDKDLNSEKEE